MQPLKFYNETNLTAWGMRDGWLQGLKAKGAWDRGAWPKSYDGTDNE